MKICIWKRSGPEAIQTALVDMTRLTIRTDHLKPFSETLEMNSRMLSRKQPLCLAKTHRILPNLMDQVDNCLPWEMSTQQPASTCQTKMTEPSTGTNCLRWPKTRLLADFLQRNSNKVASECFE